MDSASPAVRSLYDSDRRPHPFVEEWLELYRYRHLLWQWSARNLTLRYKRSVLGILWTLLEPLMIMTILTLVFSALFRFQLPNDAQRIRTHPSNPTRTAGNAGSSRPPRGRRECAEFAARGAEMEEGDLPVADDIGASRSRRRRAIGARSLGPAPVA